LTSKVTGKSTLSGDKKQDARIAFGIARPDAVDDPQGIEIAGRPRTTDHGIEGFGRANLG
jgi:hypothetical protein